MAHGTCKLLVVEAVAGAAADAAVVMLSGMVEADVIVQRKRSTAEAKLLPCLASRCRPLGLWGVSSATSKPCERSRAWGHKSSQLSACPCCMCDGELKEHTK